MRCLASVPLLVLVAALAGCGKKDDPPRELPAMAATPAPPPPVERKDLQAVHVTLPDGWKKLVHGDRDLVVFETPLADGRTANMRIKHAPAALATTAEAYLKDKLEHYWDKGVTAEIVTQEALPGGFAATIKLAIATDPDPKIEYHAVRAAGDQKLWCECEWAPDEKIRDQVAALCKSASW